MTRSFFSRNYKCEYYGSDVVGGWRVRRAVRPLVGGEGAQSQNSGVHWVWVLGGAGGQGLERYAVPRRHSSYERLVMALDIRFGTGRCRHDYI